MVNTASGTKISMKSWLESCDNYSFNNKIELIEISLCSHGEKSVFRSKLTCNELSIKCIDFLER